MRESKYKVDYFGLFDYLHKNHEIHWLDFDFFYFAFLFSSNNPIVLLSVSLKSKV